VSGAGITVGVSITRADTQTTVTGLLAIDGAMTPFPFGLDGTLNLWDPTKAISRALSVTSGGTDTGITFTINGFDVYGFPLSETRTGAAAGAALFNKAFKYVQSVTHTGSVNTTVSVGTRDVFGFPMRSDVWGDQWIVWNNTWVTANTGYTAADTTNPATTATNDVRGTYAVQGAASNGVLRLLMYQAPLPSNITSVNGVYGIPQNLVIAGGSGA
jgi:hypothetical protein